MTVALLTIIVLVGVLASRHVEATRRLHRRFSVALSFSARHPRASIAIAGIVTLVVTATLTFALHEPLPHVHDEFAYVLGAETFASGRLTNPTPDHAAHFNTFHVLVTPSYQSKYPPGQSIFLAVGVLLGHALLGVCLSLALAAAALCWMLQRWTRPRWALLGTLMFIANPLVLQRWGLSYWGGAVALTGSALTFGAMAGLLSRPRVTDGLWLGVGLTLLASTRPYEGLLAVLPCAAILLWRLIQDRSVLRAWIKPGAIAVFVLLGGLGLNGVYNHAVTGSAVRPPYLEWMSQNGSRVSQLIGSQITGADEPATKSYPFLSDARRNQITAYNEVHESIGFPVAKLLRQLGFYFGGPTLLCLLLLPVWIRGGRHRWAWISICAVTIATLLTLAGEIVHYTAPIAALLVWVIVQGMRALHALGNRAGRGALLALVALTFVRPTLSVREWNHESINSWARRRQSVQAELLAKGSRHLVLVRYTDSASWHREWVYNPPDIERAPVVFAHDFGPQRNAALIADSQDRQIWNLTIGGKHFAVVPFTPPEPDVAPGSLP